VETDDLCEIIVTAPDPAWLAGFARRLIEDRLCAGAHVIESIRSLYRWQGEIHDRGEARVALHTRRSLVGRINARALTEHPYKVPCVLAVAAVDGNPEYLAWIRDETRADVE
jgi:periplasmic divalent cation tolerance protein